jgi:hypothetical protein
MDRTEKVSNTTVPHLVKTATDENVSLCKNPDQILLYVHSQSLYYLEPKGDACALRYGT